MAIKEEIVCSGYDSYDSDTSSFLTESANKDAYTILDSGHSSRDIIIDLLRAETEGEKGLSPSALLIDGTAPLYDLTSELINRIEFTNDKINQIGSKMIAPEGNLHRFEEADQYFTRVKEKYEEYRTAVNTAIKDYNNYRAFTYTDSDEEEQKGFHSVFDYKEISPTDYDTQVPFPIDMPTYNSLDTRGRSAFNEKVDNLSKAFREAHLFYNDPYIRAKKLLNECKGLKQDEEKIDFTYSNTLDTTAESTILAPGLNTFPVDPGYEQLEFDENGKPISPDVNQENGENFINYSDFFEGGYTLIKSDGNGGYIYYCYSKDGKLRRIERRDSSKKETLTFYHYDEENGVWLQKIDSSVVQVDSQYEQLEFDEKGQVISPNVNQENGEHFINYSEISDGGYTLIKSDDSGGYVYYCYSKDGKLIRIERRDSSKKEALSYYTYDEENGVWRKK